MPTQNADTPTQKVVVESRWMVLHARMPHRVAAGVLALPCVASVAVVWAFDASFFWSLVLTVLCLNVGLLFALIALRGTVKLPIRSSATTTTEADAES